MNFPVVSAWSATLIWTIPQSVQQSSAEALMESLPDYHVYGKGDLLKPVSQRNTNLWVVEDMYGNQLDQIYYATYLTQTDNYIDLAVDEVLYQNFGVMFNFPKPNSMQYVDYRWILMNLYLASLVGGTNEAVILVVQSFTGVPPIITNVRDVNNFILTTSQGSPITQTLETTTIVSVVDGTHLEVGSTIGWVVGSALDTTASVPFTITDVEDNTHLTVNSTTGMSNGDTIVESIFYTSSPFVDSTLVVQDITTGLIVLPSLYTTEGALGYFTMNAPTTDTLQATFDTGSPIKIFDALQGATALTGLVSFTNGSAIVTGGGTLFLSQLTVGQEITDPNGIYLGTVQLITDNTHLTLVNAWAGPTEIITAYVLEYTETQLPIPVLWDSSTLAFGVLITILNPGHFPLY